MGRHRKKSGGISYVDPPSDEEIEAHATAASLSGGVRHRYSAFCTKISLPNNPQPETPARAMDQTLPNPLPLPESVDDMKKKKYQVCYFTF
jgi:hypothetical protein